MNCALRLFIASSSSNVLHIEKLALFGNYIRQAKKEIHQRLLLLPTSELFDRTFAYVS